LRGTDVDLREENKLDVGTEVGLEGKENVYLESGTLLREEDDDGTEESLMEDKTVVEELKRVPLQLAIAGRPNVGKSTLLNALVCQERVLTGPEPGLTRDSIRVQFDYAGQTVYLVSKLLFAFLCSLVSRDSFFN
jgi:predicted GTPase